MKKLIKIKILNDKENHALWGTVIFLFLSILINMHVSLFITIFVASLIEVVDFVTKKGQFEIADFVYTILIPVVIFLTNLLV